jgi:N-acetyl-beta-hexosaminidase
MAVAMASVGAVVLAPAASGSAQPPGAAVAGAAPVAAGARPGSSTELPVALVPQPADVEVTGDAPFVLRPGARIVAGGDAAGAGLVLANVLRGSTGYDLPVVDGDAAAGDITITTGVDVEGYEDQDEAYALEVDEAGVALTAPTAHGAFNGVQTLRQLFGPFVESPIAVRADWSVPAASVTDAPRFAYRGLMLDVARSFLTVDEVKAVIDDMAAFKLSALHLHLADDQGWRVEITNDGRAPGDDIDYSRLTEISGRTAMDPYPGDPTEELGRTGWYTQDDYRHLVEYADAHFITVVPEVDIPGHTNAALHAIPQLNTPGSSHEGVAVEPTAPANGTGDVGYSYLDPTSEVSFTFIEHVFSQLAEMTTGPFLHVGGDEPLSMFERYGQEVYDATLTRIVDIVQATGKTPIGFNELAFADLDEGDTIQFWTGDPAPTRAAMTERGAQVIVSRADKSYVDQKYHPETPLGLTWACRVTCDFPDYYDWDPAEFLDVSSDEGIRGVEALLWAETVRGVDRAQFMIFPRALAHAELGWSQREDKDPASFAERVASMGQRFAVQGTNFYDTPAATWDFAVAGVDSAVAPATSATFTVGLVAAPGTETDGDVLSPDVVDDVDGVSASDVPPGSRAVVDWGDGSATTTADIGTAMPRTQYNASGLYYLTGTHSYPSAGEYEGTVTVDGQAAPFTVVVAAGAPGPVPLQPVWDDSVPAVVTVEDLTVHAGDRVRIDVEGFEPGVLADVTVAGQYVGRLRPDASGHRSVHVEVPRVPFGHYTVTVAQGDRVDTTRLVVRRDRNALRNEIDPARMSVESVSSQAPDRPAAAAVDGDVDTSWQTDDDDGEGPATHHLTLDLGTTCTLTGLEYVAPQDRAGARIEDYAVYVSRTAGDRGVRVAAGSFADAAAAQPVDWTRTARGRYVTLVALSSQSGQPVAGAAEVRVGGLCRGR